MAQIKSYRTWKFKQQYEKLPQHIKAVVEKKFKMFLNNPNHPAFRAKIIEKTKNWEFEFPHYEYSITMKYRATCFKDGDTYIWVFIGTHDEFDRLY